MQLLSVKKIKNNIQLIFSTGEELLLKDEIFLKSGLRKNDFVDESIPQLLNRENQKFIAKEKAYNLLSRRNHSTRELERKLYQRKIDKNIIQDVIGELTSLNYLNDEVFAREFLEERLRTKTIGLEKIKRELSARGISREIIKDVIGDIQNLDESSGAFELAEKKLKFISKKITDKRKLRQKIYSFLINKGYGYSTIENVMNKIKLDEENE